MNVSTLSLPGNDLRSSVSSQRISSIDLLRGLVIIVMTLDHVRDYFHADAFLFNPLNLDRTSVAIFLTRWVTHFCAPVFIFLAGTSAYLVGQRRGIDELASFLLKRGIWLVIIEFTVMNVAWFFNWRFELLVFQVIGAIGVGMIILSLAARLPYKVVGLIGFIVIAGHNLLDNVHVEGTGVGAILWSLLHEFSGFPVGDRTLLLGYPILPWTAIMFLGYAFGRLYESSFAPARRKKILMYAGVGMIAAFILIRLINVYGDPQPWKMYDSGTTTFLSFINVQKYPPSLLYTLMTLGPSLIFLAVSEQIRGGVWDYVISLGRAPMFYYILHIYVIHILGVVAAIATGFSASDMVFNTWITDSPNLAGYGFSLGVVYVLWLLVVAMLLPLCLRYDRYKMAHKEIRWLSYL